MLSSHEPHYIKPDILTPMNHDDKVRETHVAVKCWKGLWYSFSSSFFFNETATHDSQLVRTEKIKREWTKKKPESLWSCSGFCMVWFDKKPDSFRMKRDEISAHVHLRHNEHVSWVIFNWIYAIKLLKYFFAWLFFPLSSNECTWLIVRMLLFWCAYKFKLI